jgi:MFS family permease
MVRRDVRGLRNIRDPRIVLALFTALNLLNYLDRTVLSAVLAPVQGDLHLSNFVAGWLPTIFLIGYFVTSPVFGALGDRVATGGRTKLIALGIAVWSAATVGSGLARGAGSLIASRAFVGLGEASYATLAPTLIDDMAPASQKSQWMSIFYAATPIGSALGYLVGGAIESAHGWRAAFFVAGGPGLAVALLCLLIVEPPRPAVAGRPLGSDAPDPARERRGAAGSHPYREGDPVLADTSHLGALIDSARALARIPLYTGTVLGYCAYTFALGGFAYWAPVYLHKQYGIGAGHASVVFGLVTVAGGSVGTLAGGMLADGAARARVRRAEARKGSALDPRETDDAVARGNVWLPALGAAIGAPLSAIAVGAATASHFFVAVFPAEVALFLLSGPINVALLRSAPPALRASAMALSIFAIHALGDLWSPPLIGLVADHAPMQVAMFAAPVVFALAAFLWFRTARTSARLT